jgi:catechol 2,3-dioxygenase-like lactoylglutathione lyase family enzyme
MPGGEMALGARLLRGDTLLITDVRVATADLAAAARFYREVLELPVSMAGDTATVTVGASTITLVESPGASESNHFAITTPSNRFADAVEWLTSRVEPLTWEDGQSELCLGEPWDSESIYFRGPDGIILELITRQQLANPRDEPFSSAHLLSVSEVGLGTPDVPAMFAEAVRVFGMTTFAGESPDFTTAGDQNGLLILVTGGRPWFPTDDALAATGSVTVTISGVRAGSMTSPAGWTVVGEA